MKRLLINCYSNKFYQIVGTSFMHSRFVTLNHISNLTVKGFQISWNAFRQKVFHNVVGVLIMPAQQLALCQHFVLRIFMSLYYPNLCSFYLVMRRITEKNTLMLVLTVFIICMYIANADSEIHSIFLCPRIIQQLRIQL